MPPVTSFSTNIFDGERVHQRCLLVTGTCPMRSEDEKEEGSISIKTKGPDGRELFPEQTWPTAGGMFKALVMLTPDQNVLEFSSDAVAESNYKINVTYIPLLQYPPLHLVIMVAKDSPLMIDCPPCKGSGFSSAHSGLDAAIAKFRMTAYMWQAMTAEDCRAKGVGRRSFRLEEEWGVDTVSRDFINSSYDDTLAGGDAMRATAKVHVIRSSRTTKQIRDADIAQQNEYASQRGALMDYFFDALSEAGGPLVPSAHPIVAGLILDSHYNTTKQLIVGHAALSARSEDGVSLGTFGSHVTYAWPRFVEEVTSCLTDIRAPGDKVGNDCGACESLWEACSLGQGSFLQMIGQAFGAPGQSGINARGYVHDWPKNFLSKTAYRRHDKSAGVMISDSTPNEARWDVSDALYFSMLDHFRLPSDPVMSIEDRDAEPVVDVTYSSGDELFSNLQIKLGVGIVRVSFNGKAEKTPSIKTPATKLLFTEQELEERFARPSPLSMHVLGFNGKEVTISNVWRMLAIKTHVRIPGSDVRLFKRSVYCDRRENSNDDTHQSYEWAQLLREKGPDGNVHRATAIDLRVGAGWDGGIVKYEDGHVSHWGPMRCRGASRMHSFGGHQSEEIELPPNVNIKRIEVNRGHRNSNVMDGVRLHLTNHTSGGAINGTDNIIKLQPIGKEVIVGFYGRSEFYGFQGVQEFGIITAPKAVGLMGLPDATFDLPELRNESRVVKDNGDEVVDEGSGSDGGSSAASEHSGSDGSDDENDSGSSSGSGDSDSEEEE